MLCRENTFLQILRSRGRGNCQTTPACLLCVCLDGHPCEACLGSLEASLQGQRVWEPTENGHWQVD